ncbi:hypothetical protein DK37_21805, partial [Halomonas sp. SUBG004]
PQWVRYVFIARLNALIDAKAAMPAKCDVCLGGGGLHDAGEAQASDQVLVVKAVERVDQIVTEN